MSSHRLKIVAFVMAFVIGGWLYASFATFGGELTEYARSRATLALALQLQFVAAFIVGGIAAVVATFGLLRSRPALAIAAFLFIAGGTLCSWLADDNNPSQGILDNNEDDQVYIARRQLLGSVFLIGGTVCGIVPLAVSGGLKLLLRLDDLYLKR